MAPRRILLVSNLWPPAIAGGAEAHAAALATRLRDRGHEVGVVTLGVDGPDVVASVRAWPYRPDQFSTQTRARRAVFHALDLYRPATRRALDRAIDRFGPDVVHSHALAGLSSNALSEPSRRGVAHVHTLHDYWLLCQRRSLTRRDGSRCEVRCRGCRTVSSIREQVVSRHPPHVVVAVSNAIAREHASEGWIPPRIRVIPNPTDVAPRTTVPHGAVLTFGFLGRLTVEKGVRTLLDAFASAALGDHRLLIAGDGPLRADVERRVGRGIEYLGWVDDAGRAKLLSSVDCLVVPSEWLDPAPLVVGEARARGIPVIGARIGGIPELVSAQSAGLLFDPGDTAALARRLQEFARAPQDFVDDDARPPVTWDEHLALIERAYDDAMRAAATSRPR